MPADDSDRFKQLLRTRPGCVKIATFEEAEALDLVREVAMDLQRQMLVWSAGYGIRDGFLAESEAEPKTDTAAPALNWIWGHPGEGVYVCLDLGAHLECDVTRRMLRDAIQKVAQRGATLVLIDSGPALPPVIEAYATEFELTLPGEKELDALVRKTLKQIHKEQPIEVDITRKGFGAILKNLRGLTRRQAREVILECTATDGRFDDEDVNNILASKRRLLKADGLLEYIQTPLTLDEIGGMNNLKRWLKHRKRAFLDEADDYGLVPPRGVLMLGVQGAGKSLCAKATATAWQQPLLRLDPGVLYNKYIGESEQNLRRALKQAEMMSPVILWIDEIEKAFASAGGQSNDGGLSRRMFGSLLTWMQEHAEPVFVVATANDIEALPPELLRKGRFDEIFFVGLPRKPARKKIFQIHISRRNRDPGNFDLDLLAEKADGFSGAEIEQAVVSALHEAFASDSEINTQMIIEALESSPPLSVTMAEKIQALYRWAEGRCVPAD
jgi:SpoVK/Ycf46/Vps4 family AAA+-type ATPase